MRIAMLFLCTATAVALASDCSAADSTGSGAVKIAVFEFELDDLTPAATQLGKPTTTGESLHAVTAAAREQLAGSGRYDIVSVDGANAKPVQDRTLRDCDGCEAAIALESGAQQSMIGIVRRATQTDYYMMVVIRDAGTGKIVNVQSANFAGGEDGWASGIRMLIKHQILVQ